jgi:C-terminal processing protease CtpA/Prc
MPPKSAAEARSKARKPPRLRPDREKAKPDSDASFDFGHLGDAVPIRKFLALVTPPSRKQRQQIVDQAIVLISELYVHLPSKTAMYAIAPVQRLKLLRLRLSDLNERMFQDEMTSIFNELRDLHTTYILPDPYQTKTAFLPFLLEEYFETGAPRYLVSKTFAGFKHPTFQPGVMVTHWNGIPIERAVELNAARNAGNNAAARHARGLERLTVRPMMVFSPPDEEWVNIRYTHDLQLHETRLDWMIFEPDSAPGGIDPNAVSKPSSRRLGIDVVSETARRAKKTLFNPSAMDAERRSKPRRTSHRTTMSTTATTMPDVLSARVVETPSGTFGYIRVWTFNVADVAAFVAEFIRILERLPDNGLILDVRSNGGGDMTAGEMLLQLFTPKTIHPELLHFINTPLTLTLSKSDPTLHAWTASIEQAEQTSATYSQGFPTDSAVACNQIGQRYTGPVVLITDALVYSATDIFAAGFQDHAIGPILGTAPNTGAGGANVWTLDLLQQIVRGRDSPFRKLARNASFRVALRRTTRVGERAGLQLEDLGVIPDMVHRLTRRDLLGGNEDLIGTAGAILAKMPVRRIKARVATRAGQIRIAVHTANIDRLDIYLDGRPQLSLDVMDGSTTRTLKTKAAAARMLEFRGFSGGQLTVSRRFNLQM